MAQICKFYGNGQCRFGQNCRFIHPGDTTQSGSSGFSSNTFGNTRQAGFGGGGGAQAKLGDGFNLPTEESIRTDLTERPTWFLSSYAPGKDPPAQLIDGKDISPEEARVMAYKLRADGNPGAYEAEWNRLTNQADTQIRNILSNLPGAVNFMRNAYENRANSRYTSSNTSPSAFGGTPPQASPFVNPEQPTSAFTQPQQTSTFSQPEQTTSAFSQQSQLTSAFGQNQQSASSFGAASPFAARPTPAFGQGTFNQTPMTPAFGQPAFGSTPAPQPQGAFRQSTFGQSSLAKPGFGQPAFGQPAFGQPPPLGQSISPFGAPTPALNPASSPSFGQPTSAFGQPSPFGASNVQKPAFGQTAFGQSPFVQASPFGTNASTQHSQPHIAVFGHPQQHIPTASAVFGNAPAANVFQQAAAQNTVSPFSNSNPFQQSQQSQVISNPFQQTTQAQSLQPISPFVQPAAAASTFGTPQQQNASPFSNQNPFQNGMQQQQQQQPVGHQVNPLLREQQKAKKWDDPVIEYMQTEIDIFTAPAFTLGHVPTVAPSREMCWG